MFLSNYNVRPLHLPSADAPLLTSPVLSFMAVRGKNFLSLSLPQLMGTYCAHFQLYILNFVLGRHPPFLGAINHEISYSGGILLIFSSLTLLKCQLLKWILICLTKIGSKNTTQTREKTLAATLATKSMKWPDFNESCQQVAQAQEKEIWDLIFIIFPSKWISKLNLKCKIQNLKCFCRNAFSFYKCGCIIWLKKNYQSAYLHFLLQDCSFYVINKKNTRRALLYSWIYEMFMSPSNVFYNLS